MTPAQMRQIETAARMAIVYEQPADPLPARSGPVILVAFGAGIATLTAFATIVATTI